MLVKTMLGVSDSVKKMALCILPHGSGSVRLMFLMFLLGLRWVLILCRLHCHLKIFEFPDFISAKDGVPK